MVFRYQLFSDDEPLHIRNKSVKKRAEELQREHTADDGQLGVIEEYIRKEHLYRVVKYGMNA